MYEENKINKFRGKVKARGKYELWISQKCQ